MPLSMLRPHGRVAAYGDAPIAGLDLGGGERDAVERWPLLKMIARFVTAEHYCVLPDCDHGWEASSAFESRLHARKIYVCPECGIRWRQEC